MSGSSARDERIARSERWELVRSSLRSASSHGFYVFDELITDKAGFIDFLAVGPSGTCVIVVRDEGGDVTADEHGSLHVNGRRFKDDPKHQASDLCEDVETKLESDIERTRSIICFTRAELYYLGDDQDVLRGVCPVWDLSLAFAEAPQEHTSTEVYEMSSRIRKAYGRPPFVTPVGAESW